MPHQSAADTRRLFLQIARRRQRPGSGSSAAFLRERTARLSYPNLSEVLIPPLRWAVVGAVATRLYMPERMTQDLDILICADDNEEVQQRLTEAGYIRQGPLEIDGSSWLAPDNFPVDIILSDASWCEEVLAEAQQNRDSTGGWPVLPLPYLTLMKFQAGRAQDLADITRMLGQASPEQLQATRGFFQRYEPEGVEDLESLILLGRLEM